MPATRARLLKLKNIIDGLYHISPTVDKQSDFGFELAHLPVDCALKYVSVVLALSLREMTLSVNIRLYSEMS